jgi:hypothetical protein
MPINYSKWDRLELSDDEDHFHPNIDNNLMIRLQREKRQQREADEAEQIKQLREARSPGCRDQRTRCGGRHLLITALCAAARLRRRAHPRRWRRLRRSSGCRSCT